MFKEINWGTVILSIILSLITVQIVMNLFLEKLFKSLIQQSIEYMNEIKRITIENIKKYK